MSGNREAEIVARQTVENEMRGRRKERKGRKLAGEGAEEEFSQMRGVEENGVGLRPGGKYFLPR